MVFLRILYSLVMLVVGLFSSPRSAVCPVGWAHNGAPVSGAITCVPPLDGPENDATRPPGMMWLQVYCAEGTRPLVVTERIVACRRAPLMLHDF